MGKPTPAPPPPAPAKGTKASNEKEPHGPDLPMMFMMAGAVCKIIELVVLRDSNLRHYFALLGGILITIGSGLVCFTSIQTMRGVYPADE